MDLRVKNKLSLIGATENNRASRNMNGIKAQPSCLSSLFVELPTAQSADVATVQGLHGQRMRRPRMGLCDLWRREKKRGGKKVELLAGESLPSGGDGRSQVRIESYH